MFREFISFIFLFTFLIPMTIYCDEIPGTVKLGNYLWQKCNYGEDVDDCSGEPKKLEWKDAIEVCRSLKLAGKKWRLPEIEELQSIIVCKNSKKPAYRDSCGKGNFDKPAIDKGRFPTTQSFFYWSNTEKKNDTFYSLFVDFETGLSNYNARSIPMYVRCISNAQ